MNGPSLPLLRRWTSRGVAALAAVVLLGTIAATAASADTAGTTITVTPSSGLTTGQTVRVSGTGFVPNSFVFISECKPRTGGEDCRRVGVAYADASGSFTSSVPVLSTFNSDAGSRSCLPANNCTIYAQSQNGAKDDHAPISFAAASTTTVFVRPTTTTFVPPTTIARPTTTFVPPTTIARPTTTFVRPTTSTTAISNAERCADIRQQRAQFNALIDASKRTTPSAYWPQLEAARASGNADFDRQLADAGCTSVASATVSAQSVGGPSTPAQNTPTSNTAATPVAPSTYTVAPGDSLSGIADELWGDRALYAALYDANRDRIRDVNLIYPGQVLVVPAR